MSPLSLAPLVKSVQIATIEPITDVDTPRDPADTQFVLHFVLHESGTQTFLVTEKALERLVHLGLKTLARHSGETLKQSLQDAADGP